MNVGYRSLVCLVSLLAACSSSPEPWADLPPTSIDSFSANPNPTPVNIPVHFSWTVTGEKLTCTLDVDNNGSTDYTLPSCTSASRVSHRYGAQGSYTARLTITDVRGNTQQRTTAVTLEAETQSPTLVSFEIGQGSQEDSLLFSWIVAGPGAETLTCRLDANDDGTWEFDGPCNETFDQVGKAAVSSNQADISLPPGKWLTTFEILSAYGVTRYQKRVRSPYNRPPVIDKLQAYSSGDLLGTINFKVSDPDGDPLVCELAVRTVGTFVFKNCDEAIRTYRFAQTGPVYIFLRVVDSLGAEIVLGDILTVERKNLGVIPVNLVGYGSNHACARRFDGPTLWCWGNNSAGQLGNGKTTSSNLPVIVGTTGVTGTTWDNVEGGSEHTCGIRDNSTLWCWGSNSAGQLGDGTTTNRSGPVQVGGSPSGSVWQTEISAGSNHTCGIRDNSTLWCWGSNNHGQLGDGTNNSSTTPVLVSTAGVSGGGWLYVALSNEGDYSCGLRSDNSAYCWGNNDKGQLGNGTTDDSKLPVAISTSGVTGSGWKNIFPGKGHTCGLRDDGSGYCWGDNQYGQLGNGTTDDSTTPTPVDTTGLAAPKKWQTLVAGMNHTCGTLPEIDVAFGLIFTGSGYCWGRNNAGQLGDGSTTNRSTPVRVGGSSSTTQWISMAATNEFSMGFTVLPSLDMINIWTWGKNDLGQLGDGSNTNRSKPVNTVFP